MKLIISWLAALCVPSTAITIFVTKKIYFGEEFMEEYDDVCGEDGRPFIATHNTLDLIFEVMDQERVDSAWVGGWNEPLEDPQRANLGKSKVTINPDDLPDHRFPVLCEDLTDDEHDPRLSKRSSKGRGKKSSRESKTKSSKKRDYYCNKKGKKCKTYFDV